MRFIKFLLILNCSLISSCFAAESVDADNCDFSRKSFSFPDIKGEDIDNSYWQHVRDPETEEYVDRLFIAYKNGDALMVEHKYCLIYNFKASYYSSSGQFTEDVPGVINLVSKMQEQNLLAKKLSVVPSERIGAQLKKSGFDVEKSQRIDFDAADKDSQNNVSYSFSYDPLGVMGMLGGMVSLYLAYGEH